MTIRCWKCASVYVTDGAPEDCPECGAAQLMAVAKKRKEWPK